MFTSTKFIHFTSPPSSRAFGIPAPPAGKAAFGDLQDRPAVRAFRAEPQQVGGVQGLIVLPVAITIAITVGRGGKGAIALQYFADGVGAGKNDISVAPFGHRAADAFQLFADFFRLDAAPQGERNQPPRGLGLGVSATPGTPHAQENFAQPGFVGVDGDK